MYTGQDLKSHSSDSLHYVYQASLIRIHLPYRLMERSKHPQLVQNAASTMTSVEIPETI